MNTKLIFVFLAGVAAASGIFYVANRHHNAATAVAEPQTAPAATGIPEPITQTEQARDSAPVVARPRPKPAPAKTETIAKAVPAPAVTSPVSPTEPAPTPVQASPQPAPVASAETPAPPRRDESRVFRPRPAEAAAAPARQPSVVTLTQGTILNVRLDEPLSTDNNIAGDEFVGSLSSPLVVGDMVIAEQGARVEGTVADAQKAGRVKGLAQISLELTRLHTSDGQIVAIETSPFMQEGPTSKTEDAKKVGAGAAIGAIIGAIAGGGKGAAVGAAAGGAAGGGAVAATRGKPAELPVETRLTFSLRSPVTITERLR